MKKFNQNCMIFTLIPCNKVLWSTIAYLNMFEILDFTIYYLPWYTKKAYVSMAIAKFKTKNNFDKNWQNI